MEDFEKKEEFVEQKQTPALPSPTSILVFGILSVAFLYSCWFSIAGIVFGFMARARSNQWVRAGEPLSVKAKIGRIMGTVGGIAGIVVTVLLPILFLCAMFGVLAGIAKSNPEIAAKITEFFQNLGITLNIH